MIPNWHYPFDTWLWQLHHSECDARGCQAQASHGATNGHATWWVCRKHLDLLLATGHLDIDMEGAA